jgi:cytidylate kinase
MSKILRDIPIERQIAKHIQWWEARREEWNRQARPSLRKPSKKPGPYISFSREHGSGGMEISWLVAEKLGWQHFDREIIESIAGRTHVREELVARFDEHIQGELQTYLYNLFTNQLLNNTQYLYHLTRVLTAIAHFGNAVIVGRGANLILPPEAGLRVRVVAPLPIRLKRLMDERGCDETSAAQEISKQDAEQRAFLNHHFRCKPDEPSAYDVVINTGYLALEAAVDFIIQLAEAKLKTTLTHKSQHAFNIE